MNNQAWGGLSADGRLLFATRMIRMFAYGLLAVILAPYLKNGLGLTDTEIGILLTLTLVGDAAISLWITVNADRIGRRPMLLAGSGLMILGGGVFAATGNLTLLTLAAIIGTISPSGNEVGPFLPIEQAGLTQISPDARRTPTLAWYNLAGSIATAMGALLGGTAVQQLQQSGAVSELTSYRIIMLVYAFLGFVLGVLFTRLSPAVEIPQKQDISLQTRFGLHRSRNVVLKLAALFSLDAFAGGLVLQTLIADWFLVRWHVDIATLGQIFFFTSLLSGLSGLLAARIAARVGLINTMVFTHIPSNILLMLVPLMPSFPLAVGALLARFSISQMDVPTRQSYTIAVVDPDERSAAGGVTNIARTIGTSLAPSLSGFFLGIPALLGMPFLLAGGLKIIYDIALYRSFKTLKPPEESSGG